MLLAVAAPGHPEVGWAHGSHACYILSLASQGSRQYFTLRLTVTVNVRGP